MPPRGHARYAGGARAYVYTFLRLLDVEVVSNPEIEARHEAYLLFQPMLVYSDERDAGLRFDVSALRTHSLVGRSRYKAQIAAELSLEQGADGGKPTSTSSEWENE